jgi:hypothetical protein
MESEFSITGVLIAVLTFAVTVATHEAARPDSLMLYGLLQ